MLLNLKSYFCFTGWRSKAFFPDFLIVYVFFVWQPVELERRIVSFDEPQMYKPGIHLGWSLMYIDVIPITHYRDTWNHDLIWISSQANIKVYYHYAYTICKSELNKNLKKSLINECFRPLAGCVFNLYLINIYYNATSLKKTNLYVWSFELLLVYENVSIIYEN